MYSYLNGILKEASMQHAILDVHGIGYKVFIPIHLFAKLPEIESPCLLYTCYIVRELSATLYGFLDRQERDLFELLQNVTGIGPRMALNLIGHLNPATLHQAIHQDNTAILCKVPGIGKKTAERLIIELRDKLGFIPSELKLKMETPNKSLQGDAVNALIHLGYHSSVAQKATKKALSELPEDCDLSTLITHSLRSVS
ncbi:MAG: Holliday junction branch migration protein RuvA [Parachlamydiaceae bacterium]